MEDSKELSPGEKAMNKLVNQSTKEEVRVAIPVMRRYIHAQRNELKNCPFCNAHIEDRTESIYAELMCSLYKVMKWCEEKGVHEFDMKDIRHLLGQINYTRFGNLVRYGGIVYPIKGEDGKRKTGNFGIHLERAHEFFENKRQIPVSMTIDMITGEIIGETLMYAREMPALKQFLDTEGRYHSELPAQQTIPV